MSMRFRIVTLLTIVIFSCHSKVTDESLLRPFDLDEDRRVHIKNPIVYWNDHFGNVSEIEIDHYSIRPSLKTGQDTLFRVMGDWIRRFYNEQQQLMEERVVFDDKILSVKRFRYDDAGNPVRLDATRDSMAYDFHTERELWGDYKAWTYDRESNLLRKEVNDRFQIYYNYDSLGRISSKHVRPFTYPTWFDYTYRYYGNSTRIREEVYQSTEQVVSTRFSYDSAGNMTKKVSQPESGNWRDSIAYRYDGYGNPIAEQVFRESYVLEYEYEYDSLHNWTKKTAYYNGRKTDVFFRRLKYQ